MSLIKQVVPWFDKQEWELVYKYAYSMDIDLQREAYQRMIIWKARVPYLCMGVECTQSFLHIRMCEVKENANGCPVFEDVDLQPLYCTAIMRFLNFLQGLCENKTTLYQMADIYSIPEWIINMRHETAHGNKLPALGLLKDAADCIYNWLNKNYWEKELQQMKDFILPPSKVINKDTLEPTIEKLLEIWSSLKLYELKYKTVQEVPNKEFIDLINELSNISPQQKFDPRRKLEKISQKVLEHLFQMLQEKSTDKVFLETCLIKKLVNNQTFLPKIDWKSCKETLIVVLINIWEEMVIKIQKQGLMLSLLQCLLDISKDSSDLRQFSAALWIRSVTATLSFNNTTFVKKQVIDEVILNKLSEVLIFSFCPTNAVFCIVEESYPDFKESLHLEPLSFLGRDQVQQFIKDALLLPSESTSLFIYNLLDLWEPPLEPSSKKKLSQLVKLYIKGKYDVTEEKNGQNEIMTLDTLVNYSRSFYDLYESIKTSDEIKKDDVILAESCEGNWMVYPGEESWDNCALGITPWQNKSFMDMSLQSN